MRVYLAGPMSGIPDDNQREFDRAAAVLRAEGHFVLVPSSLNPPGGYRQCLAVDMAWICAHAEMVAFLPGWENSKGARAEHALAECLASDRESPLAIRYLTEAEIWE